MTVDEIRKKYTCDAGGVASQIEAKWNSLMRKAKASLKPNPYIPKKKDIDPAIKQELQKLYDQTKADAEELKHLAIKMGDAGVGGYRVVT